MMKSWLFEEFLKKYEIKNNREFLKEVNDLNPDEKAISDSYFSKWLHGKKRLPAHMRNRVKQVCDKRDSGFWHVVEKVENLQLIKGEFLEESQNNNNPEPPKINFYALQYFHTKGCFDLCDVPNNCFDPGIPFPYPAAYIIDTAKESSGGGGNQLFSSLFRTGDLVSIKRIGPEYVIDIHQNEDATYLIHIIDKRLTFGKLAEVGDSDFEIYEHGREASPITFPRKDVHILGICTGVFREENRYDRH